jgi:CoA-transferase family III
LAAVSLGQLLDVAWSAVTDGTAIGRSRPIVEVTGDPADLPSRFAVEEIAVACVATALGACSGLTGRNAAAVVDRNHVAAAVTSERWFRQVGMPVASSLFAPLSRFWRTGDGWVRTHANYPWHRDALLKTLGVDGDPDAVAAAFVERRAEDIEESVVNAGGVAAAVRTVDEWSVHPQGRAVANEPLVGHELVGEAPARRPTAIPDARRAANNVRVVDLTRVIAGPVCTRMLGALGADVLRVDPPEHLDLQPGAPSDSLLGKRSTFLELRAARGAEKLHELLHSADVVVCGYRPGALDRFGLGADALAERHPGLVVVYLDAWGHTGPWSHRRGFDSVVQAPSGIAMGESIDGATPGSLPCQLLDHGTGYLAAAAVLDGLQRQRDQGGTHVRRLSLARTAWWLTSTDAHDQEAGDTPVDGQTWLSEIGTRDTAGVVAVAPPGRLDGQALAWPSPVTSYGADEPNWPI